MSILYGKIPSDGPLKSCEKTKIAWNIWIKITPQFTWYTHDRIILYGHTLIYGVELYIKNNIKNIINECTYIT